MRLILKSRLNKFKMKQKKRKPIKDLLKIKLIKLWINIH
uniref:Uncharacterized protein n=1 Tax=Borrelia garinii subsp. bavariensis (strain ATCC BAA-2496 / DSM 23469 / PBi) TaxID=290434 RepID=A0A7I6GX97_BORGP|nr:hypothetical protein BGP054 [Borreliella bavariensis PBi]